MRNQVLVKILTEYDSIITDLFLESAEEIKRELKLLRADFDLIRTWRDEIESDYQSIYVIGKTSTGKSAFHNALLDNTNRRESLFKESAKVETGVVQTLQNSEPGKNPRLKLNIKDMKNFNMLTELKTHKESTRVYIHPLTDDKLIIQARENIIAKPKNGSRGRTFDPAIALSKIDIYHPMSMFQEFIFFDTPGLGSHFSATDETVRAYISGRSNIFWFLDGSNRSLQDDLSLLKENERFILDEQIFKRIIFIFNRFDLLDVQNGFVSPAEKDKVISIHEKRERAKVSLLRTLKSGLAKISGIKNMQIHAAFTSLKSGNMDKQLGLSSTRQELVKLENSLTMNNKNREYDNLKSLTVTLKILLEKVSAQVIQKRVELIKNSQKKEQNEAHDAKKKWQLAIKGKTELTKTIIKCKSIIDSCIPEKAKNRDEYRDMFKQIRETELGEVHQRLSAFLSSQYEYLELPAQTNTKIADLKLFTVKRFKTQQKILFPNGRDKERKEHFEISRNRLIAKKQELNDLKVEIVSAINKYVSQKKDEQEKHSGVYAEKSQRLKTIQTDMKSIRALINKVKNIFQLLNIEIEEKISAWQPLTDYNNKNQLFENFLELYSSVHEYNSLMQYTGKGIHE